MTDHHLRDEALAFSFTSNDFWDFVGRLCCCSSGRRYCRRAAAPGDSVAGAALRIHRYRRLRRKNMTDPEGCERGVWRCARMYCCCYTDPRLKRRLEDRPERSRHSFDYRFLGDMKAWDGSSDRDDTTHVNTSIQQDNEMGLVSIHSPPQTSHSDGDAEFPLTSKYVAFQRTFTQDPQVQWVRWILLISGLWPWFHELRWARAYAVYQFFVSFSIMLVIYMMCYFWFGLHQSYRKDANSHVDMKAFAVVITEIIGQVFSFYMLRSVSFRAACLRPNAIWAFRRLNSTAKYMVIMHLTVFFGVAVYLGFFFRRNSRHSGMESIDYVVSIAGPFTQFVMSGALYVVFILWMFLIRVHLTQLSAWKVRFQTCFRERLLVLSRCLPHYAQGAKRDEKTDDTAQLPSAREIQKQLIAQFPILDVARRVEGMRSIVTHGVTIRYDVLHSSYLMSLSSSVVILAGIIIIVYTLLDLFSSVGRRPWTDYYSMLGLVATIASHILIYYVITLMSRISTRADLIKQELHQMMLFSTSSTVFQPREYSNYPLERGDVRSVGAVSPGIFWPQLPHYGQPHLTHTTPIEPSEESGDDFLRRLPTTSEPEHMRAWLSTQWDSLMVDLDQCNAFMDSNTIAVKILGVSVTPGVLKSAGITVLTSIATIVGRVLAGI